VKGPERFESIVISSTELRQIISANFSLPEDYFRPDRLSDPLPGGSIPSKSHLKLLDDARRRRAATYETQFTAFHQSVAK
jgi:hypothetical protein